MAKLIHCAFCGSKDLENFNWSTDWFDDQEAVHCLNCHAQVLEIWWNKRV